MATRVPATTQQTLVQQAWAALAIIGGELTSDADITFEGEKFVFPVRFESDLPGLNQHVARYVQGQEEMVTVDRTFDYRPFDGAHAVYQVMKARFGYAQGKAKQTLFGKQPPEEIVVATGYANGKLEHVAVPWGLMILPGLKGASLQVTSVLSGTKGTLLRLYSECRKADQKRVLGFYEDVARYLREASIYRGKCINGAMEFIDTDAIDPEQFVFTERVMRQAQTHIFSPMIHTAVIKANGLNPKRVNLLGGAYGVGKTGLGRIAAKHAVDHDWTAMICRPGQDDPFECMQTLALYTQGSDGKGGFLFCEDVDVLASTRDPQIVTQLLDRFDGFTSKGENMVFVMTTNHPERIHKGMVRPGRLDSIIKIGDMDREGVERLCKLVVGEHLDRETDFDAVFEACSGFTPAYVREAIERALRFVIARTGVAGAVSTDDLIGACDSLRDQYDLQQAASDKHESLPALESVFTRLIAEHAITEGTIAEVVVEQLNETKLVNPDSGKHIGNLMVDG